jgi:hypothetical protein
VGVVAERDLVDYAYETLVPAVLVVVGLLQAVVRTRRRIGVSSRCICEAWLRVWNAGQIEGQSQRRYHDVHLRQRPDSAHASECLVAQVGAICQVQHRLLLVLRSEVIRTRKSVCVYGRIVEGGIEAVP